MLCCVGWAGSFVIAAWALNGTAISPFLLAAVRAVFVLIVMGVFLFKPLPNGFFRMLIVGLCVGPIHLGLLYTGLETATASGASILSQALIPLATLFSVIWLKERVTTAQSLAITGALLGVVIMIYEPNALSLDIGLLYVLGAYSAMAIGTVIMRRVPDVDWRVYVAWTAVMILIFCAAMSFLFETDQAKAWQEDKWPLLITAAYAAMCVSVFSHGQYFRLIQSYPVNRVVPLTIMITVFATLMGVTLLNETLYPRYIVGAVLILPCVWYIASRGQSDAKPQKEGE